MYKRRDSFNWVDFEDGSLIFTAGAEGFCEKGGTVNTKYQKQESPGLVLRTENGLT